MLYYKNINKRCCICMRTMKGMLSILVLLLCLALSSSQERCISDNEYLCSNGDCILKEFICDGSKECVDGSDETTNLCKFQSCRDKNLNFVIRGSNNLFTITPAGENQAFQCNYGACISSRYMCDGTKHCFDGSDETTELCSSNRCKADEYRCGYGACISRVLVCNNRYNCYDGSDETADACLSVKRQCNQESYFMCNYGACILKSWLCNNRLDCLDGSDEGEVACKIAASLPLPIPSNATEKPSVVPQPVETPLLPTQQTTIMTPSGNKEGCFLSQGDDAEIQIIQCGKVGGCVQGSKDILHLPRGTVLILVCLKDLEREPFLCFENKLWHPFTDTMKGPASRMCSATSGNAPSASFAPVRGCSRETEQGEIRIVLCGGTRGGCNGGDDLPGGTIVTAICENSQQEAFICKEDSMWHSQRNPNEPPRSQLCSAKPDTVVITVPRPSPGNTISVTNPFAGKPNIHISRPPEEIPTECGDDASSLFRFPWLAGLFRDGSYSCSGVLISPSLVLTAGHCVVRNQATSSNLVDKRKLTVQYYSLVTAYEMSRVSDIVLHPEYRGGVVPLQDIAIIRLSRRPDYVPPVCLDSRGKLAGKSALTFNRTEGQSNYRWNVDELTLDTSCYNRATRCSRHLDISADQFCGINEDNDLYLHRGSSGAPYLIMEERNDRRKWSVAGILSYSVVTSDCRKPHAIFTAVNKYYDWIMNCGFYQKC